MSEGHMGKLEPVDLRAFWKDEARDFTPWLAEEANLATLSETLCLDLEIEDSEVAVGAYKADLVARDPSSRQTVVIENQLGKTDHDHLGKILTYASGLNAGVIVWIAREFTEEHRQAVDFLNEKASANLRCFGVEIKLWRIGDSLPAPQFEIVAGPNEYRTQVTRQLTPAQTLYVDFWNAFRQYCMDHKTLLSLRKASPQHWLSIAVGRTGFELSLTLSTLKRRIGCELYLSGQKATRAFHLLAKDKQRIEEELGPLKWMELPDGQDCRIVRFKQPVDLRDQANWEQAHAWLKDQAEHFHRTFSPRIKALPSLDEVGEEEAEA